MADLDTKPDLRAKPNVRDKLIAAALQILDDEGIDALTLRSVAKLAGVSHAAPARHFKNLADLKAEVAAEGYQILSQAVRNEIARMPPSVGALGALATAAHAYITGALTNPGLFALMVRMQELDLKNAALDAATHQAFEGFLLRVESAQQSGWRSEQAARPLAATLWASVHGLSLLWLHGAYQETHIEASIDEAISIMLDSTPAQE